MREHAELMRLARAVTVLDGVPVSAAEPGLRPGGSEGIPVISWDEVSATLGPDDPLDPAPRRRLALLVALHELAAQLGGQAARSFARQSRLLALPVGHPLHPGTGWVRQRVAGGVLELGVGVVDLLPGQVSPLPLPPGIEQLAGQDVAAGWAQLVEHAEGLGRLAGRRLRTTGNSAVLCSLGGCDALTLATTTSLRDHLLATSRPAGSIPSVGPAGDGAPPEPSGVGTGAGRAEPTLPIAAPRRDRVWTGDRATDRDRARAVWLLTPGQDRGVLEPLRLSEDGVEPVRLPVSRGTACAARPGGHSGGQRSGTPRTGPCVRS